MLDELGRRLRSLVPAAAVELELRAVCTRVGVSVPDFVRFAILQGLGKVTLGKVGTTLSYRGAHQVAVSTASVLREIVLQGDGETLLQLAQSGFFVAARQQCRADVDECVRLHRVVPELRGESESP